jgi:hypothetical protein
MIFEEIKEIKSDKKELRKFGFTIGIVLLVIGSAFLYFGKPSGPYFIGFGTLLCLIGLINPSLLKLVHKIWMGLSVVLGFIMTRVILTILFFFVFMPIRFIARTFGKKFIDLNFKEKTDSYWNKRNSKIYEPIDTERQF